MKSPRAISTRLSAFRFSLYSLRSPVSPMSPRIPELSRNDPEALSTCHSESNSDSSTAKGSPDPNKKEAGVAVTVVDDENLNTLRSPTALPTFHASPLTPWQATFHRNAASAEQEMAYLKRTAHLRYARLALSVMLLATSATMTGLESDIVARYNRTHLDADWHLSLWPTDLNLKPTLLALSTSSVTTLLALLAVLVAAIPGPNPRMKLNVAIFTTLCMVATPLSLATLILSAVISPSAIFSSFISTTLTSLVRTTGPSNTVGLTPNGDDSRPQRETIQSFTCAIASTAKAFNEDASTLELPTLTDSRNLVPSGFSKICVESKAGLGLAIVLLVFASMGLLLSCWTWVIGRKIERLRGEREVMASRTGSRNFQVDGKEIPESLVGHSNEKAV